MGIFVHSFRHSVRITLQVFLSICGPHLGVLHSAGLLSTGNLHPAAVDFIISYSGTWLMEKISRSDSIREMRMEDNRFAE